MSSRNPASAPDEADSCTLCGLPVPASGVSADGVKGAYCCHGCLSVQRTLEDLEGAEADAVQKSIKEDVQSENVSPDPPDGETAFFAVEGMHCSTCEAFVEGRASTCEGIHAAEASYANESVRVTYDPSQIAEDRIPERLSGYGYRVRDQAVGRRGEREENQLTKFLAGGGLFGMMVMVWYVLFLYPTYFGYDPVVQLGGYDGLYVFANIWLLTSFVLFYTGWPILRGAWVSLRVGLPNMDLLVALAASSAYLYSTVAMLVGRTDLYFDVTVAIILVVTAGTYAERVMKDRALGRLTELVTGQEREATRLPGGESVPIDALEAGDRILVRPGERIPLDGTIEEGTAAVDESLLTGEPVPIGRGPGDAVIGGTVPTDGSIVVAVDDRATSTRHQLIELLWKIQSSRSGVQRLADKLATVFVPLVVIIAALVTGILLASGAGGTTALLLGLTVLIVSCPCALGLATPLAIASSVGSALKQGIVFASTAVIEEAPKTDIVVFDKTGTLTSGVMEVMEVYGEEETEILARAAQLETHSSHPIAEAIVGEASDHTAIEVQPDGGTLLERDADAIEHHQRGMSGVIEGERVIVGHPELVGTHTMDIPGEMQAAIEKADASGHVPVVVAWGGRVRGVITVGDKPRQEWRAAIESVAREHDVVVITGDEGHTVDWIRSIEMVDMVFDGVPPEGKVATVKRLQQRGTVAMVGDGTNDAPALATADFGIALASGTALATDAADAIILSDDLQAVGETFQLAQGANRRIKQNLGWAFVYNGIAIPLALTGLLNPLFAAVAMATSSLLVVGNSARSLGPSPEARNQEPIDP